VQSALRRRKPLGWPENEVITFSRDAEINTIRSSSSGELQTALLINWLCETKTKL